MAKYYGSPWGTIIGGLGNTVGTKVRGVNCVRERTKPENPKTVKQTNWRRVFAMHSHIAKTNLKTIIYPIFEKECKKRKLKFTGRNLFTKVNASKLYNSMPDKNKKLGGDNIPDYTKMLVSIGRLESCWQIISTSYNKSTGEISIKWHTGIYQNGREDDEVYIGAFEKPQKKLPYGRLTILNTTAKRSDGEVTINHRLSTINCFIYIFFKNESLGYSPSRGCRYEEE